MRRATILVMVLSLAVPLGLSGPVRSEVFKCLGKRATVVGSNRSQTLRGTAGADVIVGLGGADTIKGLDGADKVCGGGGNDTLIGGPGRDQLSGGSGTDECLSGESLTSCETDAGATACPPSLVQDTPWREPFIEVWLDEGKTVPENHLSGVGEMDVAMVFVDFSDFPASESTEALYDFHAPPAMEFWNESSQGRMSMTVTPFHKWYRMPLPSTEYPSGLARTGGFSLEKRQLMRDAVKVSDPEIDYSPFEAVAFVASKGAASGGSGVIIAIFRKGLGITADGNEIRFTQMIASVPDGAGGYRRNGPEASLMHDTAHWLGMSDTYVFGPDGPDFTPVGRWDMTSLVENPLSFVAWHQWKVGWLGSSDFACLNNPGTIDVTLSPVATMGGTKAAVVPITPSQAYVAEVRENVGIDAGACDFGVLVYRVNAGVNNAAGTMEVQTAAEEDPALSSSNACGPKYNAPYGLEDGEASVFEDPERGVRIEVLEKIGIDYRVRVSYTGPQISFDQDTSPLPSGPHISGLGVSPKPFDPATGQLSISYRVSEPDYNSNDFDGGPIVDITIFTAAGQRVRTLQEQLHVGWGAHTVTWDGKNDDGVVVGPGTYTFDIDAFGLRTGRSATGSFTVER